MASNNPYDEGVFSDQPAQPAAPATNPYDTLPTPIGSDTSAVTKAADKPYSTFNTVGRMATDAALGLPDTINMAARGLNYGVDRAMQAAGIPLPSKPADYGAIPYVAPIARKAIGVAELPADAGLGRSLAEAGGSALIGGAGSATARGLVRGAAALPEVISSMNPWRPIKRVTEDALEASGNRWYNALDNLDVRYNPQTGPRMANAIDRGAFRPRGINDANAGQAISNVDQLRTIDPAANVPYGTVKDYIVPRDIEGVRQALNRTRSQAGTLPGHREGEAANIAIGGIDRFLQNPPASAIHPTNLNDVSLVGPVLSNARGDTAAAHRVGFLEGTRDAIGTQFAAKPTASASSEAQALRDRAAAALNASREGTGPLYGFNDYEKQLLEKTSRASLLSRIGAGAPKSPLGLLMQGVGTGATAHLAGMPTSVSGALGVGVPAGEYVAKKLGDWGTRRSYQRAVEAIAARSPLAQSMGIAAPPTARLPGASLVTRDDIAAALMAPSMMRQPVEEGQ